MSTTRDAVREAIKAAITKEERRWIREHDGAAASFDALADVATDAALRALEAERKPVAWAYYWPDGGLAYIEPAHNRRKPSPMSAVREVPLGPLAHPSPAAEPPQERCTGSFHYMLVDGANVPQACSLCGQRWKADKRAPAASGAEPERERDENEPESLDAALREREAMLASGMWSGPRMSYLRGFIAALSRPAAPSEGELHIRGLEAQVRELERCALERQNPDPKLWKQFEKALDALAHAAFMQGDAGASGARTQNARQAVLAAVRSLLSAREGRG